MAGKRLIETEKDVAEGTEWLASACPRMAFAIDRIGAPPLRRRPDGFSQLLGAIISQQVSVASASAITARMKSAGALEPDKIRAMSETDLRGLGLSRQKARYACALADANIDYKALRDAPDEEAIKTLCEVPGIGRWTAEVYAMFSLGRPDVFAPGDLALQEATRALYRLDARPKERELRERAAAWSPWRSVAARVLFAYYRVIKEREGIS